MALIWPQKNYDATANFEVDWTVALAGDTIVTSLFTFIVPADLVINSQSNTTTSSTIVLSAGTAGLTGELLCTINTAAGNVLTTAVNLPIVDPETAQPQTTTKGLIVSQAFEEIGLWDFEFNVTPQETQTGLTRLDMLMAELQGPGNNLALGYNTPPAIGASNLTDAAGIADSAVNAIVVSLALRICPRIGKVMSAESRLAYSQGMNALRAAYQTIPDRLLGRGTPRGAGQKPWGVWWPFGFNNGSSQ